MTETALGATAPTEEKAPEFVTLSIVHAASQSRKMFAFGALGCFQRRSAIAAQNEGRCQ